MAQSFRLFVLDLMRLDRANVPTLTDHIEDFRCVCWCLDPNGNVGLRAKAPLERVGQFGTPDRLSQIAMHSNQSHSHACFLACERRLRIGRGKDAFRSIALVALANWGPQLVIRSLGTQFLDRVEVYGVGHAVRVVHVVR